MDTVIREKALELIKASIWNTSVPDLTAGQAEAVFQIFKTQAITSLPEKVLPRIPALSDKLKKSWRNEIVHIFRTNLSLISLEKGIINLLDSQDIKFVILKGTSVASYYPDRDLRALGDIDILTATQDHDKACEYLLSKNFVETTDDKEKELGRLRSFQLIDSTVEVHRFFTLAENSDKIEYLDRRIQHGINETHRLDDITNGLIMLEHIHQHLLTGLGLRHVIDWMVFVDKCLNEDNWSAFLKEAEQIGLSKLASVLVKMCEMYLGLKPRFDYGNVNEAVCADLLDYAFLSGNFGRAPEWESTTNARVMSRIKNPADLFRHLQIRGLENWESARKHKALRPFAWIYQIGRVVKKNLTKKDSAPSISDQLDNSKKLSKLLEGLGVEHSYKVKQSFDSEEYIKKITD